MADALRNGIVINEFLADPTGPSGSTDTDGNNVANGNDEFVELFNSSDTAIDIGGLQLWDAGRGNWFTFPDGTILEPGARAVVIRNADGLPDTGPNDLAFDADFGSDVLNNGGDNIVLFDPLADEYVSATYNGDTLDSPENTYAGFSNTASRVGAGEDFGDDIDGFSIQRAGDGSDSFVNDALSTPAEMNAICFAGRSFVDTPQGPKRIALLRAGDLVLTAENNPMPILWIGKKRLNFQNFTTEPRHLPVEIKRGALGPNLPDKTLLVSQQHRILMQGPIVQDLFATSEVLVAAKELTLLRGVRIKTDQKQITYVHILLDGHQLLQVHGIRAESLYLGHQALNSLHPKGRAEVLSIFPELADRMPDSIRPIVAGRQARAAIKSHRRSGRFVL